MNTHQCLRELGCRPSEACRVEGRHVDLSVPAWVFPPEESKTGEERTVYLTPGVVELTKRLRAERPEGQLLLDRPWKASLRLGRFPGRSPHGKQAATGVPRVIDYYPF